MRWLGLVIVVAGLGCHRAERLNGGGSSFVYPIMLKWSRCYAQERGVEVDFQATGSGNGVRQMLVGTTHFGCTEAVTHEAGTDVVHIPIVLGGIVPAYHLSGLPMGTRLKFDGPTLARIFHGDIRRWDDPALAALNPGVSLPGETILVVGRSDPSGTTAVFAEYLAQAAPEIWGSTPMGTATRWPVGEAARGNEGVAGLISRVPGSLGYIELKYAIELRLQYGTVRNRDGADVLASPDTISAAGDAAIASRPTDFRFTIINAPGRDSYPIACPAWAVFHRRQSPTVDRELISFLRWVTDAYGGQAMVRELGYAPLPLRLSQSIHWQLDRLAEGQP